MTDFENLYEMYFRDVYLYIRRLSGDEHIAEEISSETFFKAIRAIDGFRGDCDIRVWLCQIAKNCYLNYQKSQKRISSIEKIDTRDIVPEDGSIEEQFVRHDDVIRIQKILHEIPEPYKEVFMWRVFAELNFKQIGLFFGKSENWACVTHHRARNMIKKRMGEYENEK